MCLNRSAWLEDCPLDCPLAPEPVPEPLGRAGEGFLVDGLAALVPDPRFDVNGFILDFEPASELEGN